MGQTQNPRHVTTANFGGRLANLAVELDGFFNNEDTRLGPFAFEHERSRGAGKRASDDYDVEFEIHRNRENGRGQSETQSVPELASGHLMIEPRAFNVERYQE